MDAMVIKYLMLTTVAYGLHTFLALTQFLLALFLIISGVNHLRNKSRLGRLATRFGFIINKQEIKKPIKSWLMVFTGILLLFPLLGLSYWFGVISCIVAIYWIIALAKTKDIANHKPSGSLARKGLIFSSVLLFGFTIWEGRDLMRAAWDVSYKAAYWRNLEVSGWQKDNNPNAPKVGEIAPDFEITDVYGEKTVRLSDFRGQRPVVLLFGSFT